MECATRFPFPSGLRSRVVAHERRTAGTVVMKTLFALVSSCAACTSLLVFLARPCPAYAQDAKPAASPPPQNQAEPSSGTRKLEQHNIDLSKGEVAKQAQPSAPATAPATQRTETALPNATPAGDTVPRRAALAAQSAAASANQPPTPTSQLSGGSDTFVATATKRDWNLRPLF